MEVPDVEEMGSVMSGMVRRVRRAVAKTLLVVDVAAIVLATFHIYGSFRFVISLAFGLAVPGWSIVGFLRIRETALLVALSIASSLCIEMVLGEALLAWWWHLQVFELILGVICAFLLSLQLRALASSSKDSAS